ncbi:MAG: alpha-xylosidase [Clostridia bacterium]|nr:alpha-xylosidase [Clostridia bacterium]MBQ4157581.1 alpha-xylosidase [Clostridia bacterium]
MKFNIGEWVMKPGVESKNAEQIRAVYVSDDKTSVHLYAVTYREDYRGLDGPSLEIDITSPMENIIRIQIVHFKGERRKMPAFEINDRKCNLQIERENDRISIASGDTKLVITYRPASFIYFYKGERITAVGDRFSSPMISYITTSEGPFMRGQLDVGVGEKVYGLGEHFTAFVKNGQTVEIWNEDGGTSSEIGYKNVPFYVTNRGYGVLVNDPGPVSMEVCTEAVTRVQFSVPGQKLDFMVVGGGDMKGVLKNYTALTGRPALPPVWTFGLWLSSSFTTSYDENTVLSFVDGMLERNIPLSVFHFDCFWMKENEWCSFVWDEDMFPDVEGLLKKLHDRGLKVCVWINPYIGQKSRVFDELMEKDYLLNKPDGDVWQWDRWQAGLGVIDFTNPDAVKWYKDQLKRLMRQGVDCFKTDFGERIPTDVKYFDGSDPERMHNYYTYIYNKIVFEAIQEERGFDEACVFARSATVGGQKFPVHWGGDCNSTYPSMAESLRGGLSLCLSGFGFWSHDMGGFEGTAPEHVYKRWLAFGLLSTHSRLHGSDSYRVPWLFGDEAVEVCRAFSKLKTRLLPYIYAAAAEAHDTGVPAMRAMVLEFPGDLGAEDCDRQYMLGDSILVAPVMREDGIGEFYLPDGMWTHLLTGDVKNGGRWMREKYDFFSLPLFVRENTLLPMANRDDKIDLEIEKNLTVRVYSLTGKAKREIKNMHGETAFAVTAKNCDGKVRIEIDGKYEGLSIQMMNVPAVSKLSGAREQRNENGIILVPDTGIIEFEM